MFLSTKQVPKHDLWNILTAENASVYEKAVTPFSSAQNTSLQGCAALHKQPDWLLNKKMAFVWCCINNENNERPLQSLVSLQNRAISHHFLCH